MSYSQNQEDLIVKAYFNGHIGRLLDIGANDGITFSNSRLLIEMGWEADLFEPSSIAGDLFLLYKDSDRVHVYAKGIAATIGNKTFYESGAHLKGGSDRALVSTCIAAEMNRWKGVEFKLRPAEFVDFNGWHQYADSPALDFISIDVEGMEMEILQQINLSEVGCKCLCIEWNSQPHLAKLYTDYCAQFRLKEIHRNAENIIYAA